MADDKIVTKKTPVKAAVPAKRIPAKRAAPKTVAATPAPVPTKAAAQPAVPKVKAMPAVKPPVKPPVKPTVDAQTRQAMIEEAAYYKSEARNFAAGFEAQDWAEAEREIDALLGK